MPPPRNSRDSKKAAEFPEAKAELNQHYAKIVKTLGDGRFQVFRNDGKTFVASVRGKMWKRCWFNPGDIVMMEMVDLNSVDGIETSKATGLIIARVESTFYGELKKVPGVNPRLISVDITVLASGDSNAIQRVYYGNTGGGAGGAPVDDDDLFIRDGEEHDSGDESDTSKASHDSKKKEKKKKAGQKTKEGKSHGDINIDEI
jgi:initiation factor 1A